MEKKIKLVPITYKPFVKQQQDVIITEEERCQRYQNSLKELEFENDDKHNNNVNRRESKKNKSEVNKVKDCLVKPIDIPDTDIDFILEFNWEKSEASLIFK